MGLLLGWLNMAVKLNRIQSGATNNTWRWDSSNILKEIASQDKTFYEMRVSYEGTLPTIALWLNGTTISAPTLTIIETGVGEYKLPILQRRGKKLKFRINGSADTIVNDISVVYRVRSKR